MRKFAKIMAVLLALAVTAPCFAEGKVVTKWSCTDNGETMYLTFYDDGTAEATPSDSDSFVFPYIGDTKKNGSISFSGSNNGTTIEIRGDRLFMDPFVFTKVKK